MRGSCRRSGVRRESDQSGQVLHPADQIRRLIRPGRVVVVDEAFMDAVPGESQPPFPATRPGQSCARPTKTWGWRGCGLVGIIGDPTLIAALRRIQTPWAVSSPALAAIRAVCFSQRTPETHRWQEDPRTAVTPPTADLRALGLHVVDSDALFLLVRGPAAA